ncbi:MAG: hypothetical protein IJY03_02180 [Prevotella sp.]|nr:hypothetical protein [Prevotella sp.]
MTVGRSFHDSRQASRDGLQSLRDGRHGGRSRFAGERVTLRRVKGHLPDSKRSPLLILMFSLLQVFVNERVGGLMLRTVQMAVSLKHGFRGDTAMLSWKPQDSVSKGFVSEKS